MCDPISLLVASAVVGTVGAISEANAAANAAEYSAEVQEQNAILADRRARDAIERGQLEEERAKREATALRKEQEASFAAANIDTSFGSPLDIIVSSAAEGEQQAAIIRANAEREAEDFEFEAFGRRSQASLDRASAQNQRTGGIFAGLGTALSGGSGVFSYAAQNT